MCFFCWKSWNTMRHLKHDNVAVILFFQVLEGWFYQLVGESVRKALKDGESSWGNGFLKVPQSPAHQQYFVSTSASLQACNIQLLLLREQEGVQAAKATRQDGQVWEAPRKGEESRKSRQVCRQEKDIAKHHSSAEAWIDWHGL